MTQETEGELFEFEAINGEQICRVCFSTKTRSITIVTSSGALFVVSVTEAGELEATLIDVSDIVGQLPN